MEISYSNLIISMLFNMIDSVPAPTVSEYLQNIADYINQSLIFMMYKTEK
jgi:hypothetical protein